LLFPAPAEISNREDAGLEPSRCRIAGDPVTRKRKRARVTQIPRAFK